MSTAYKESFPVGSDVRIAAVEELEQFRREWRYHHPLEAEQVSFAGRAATVATVGFYHGGDVLYTLEDIPGIWHECCLRS